MLHATGRVWALAVATAVGTGTAALAGDAPCDETKLLASDGTADDRLGTSVSVSGDVVVAGAWLDDQNGNNSGSAYVFQWDGTGWVEAQKLLPSVGVAGDGFGISVSVDGDVAAVGADNASIPVNTGAVYVFRRDGTGWVEEQKLLAADAAAGDRFGAAVGVSGDVIVVGAPFDDGLAGSACVFRWDGSSWTEEQKLIAPDGAAGDWFGSSVAASGDSVVIGAPFHDEGGSDSGAAYVYRDDGASWTFERKLIASDGVAGDNFGISVAVDGDVALAGAPGADVGGSAYVFRRTGASWIEEQKLLAPDGAAGDAFGGSVSLGGDVAAIAAHQNDDQGPESGSVYLFRFDGATWTMDRMLLASDGDENDRFGDAVSIQGHRVAVGAPTDEDNGLQSGSLYVFELDCDAACPADVNADGEVGVTDLTFVILAWGQSGGAADVNGDGDVGVLDLIEVITNWGPCS